MRRSRYRNRAQLVLELDRPAQASPVDRDTKRLVETLADLLIEALGAVETPATGGVDE